MFAKVFGQIFDSSIAEDYNCRRMFMDLLVLADPTGAVDMTHEAIARRTNVPIEQVRRYIAELCQPDKTSRSKLHEGKRLLPLDSARDWGWQIVNYEHYRTIRDEEARRTYFRDYQRQYRKEKKKKKLKSVKDKSLTKFNSVENASSSSSSKNSKEGDLKRKPKSAISPDDIYSAYPLKVGKPAALRAIKRCFANFDPAYLLDRTRLFAEKRAGDLAFCPYPATFFNQARFADDPKTWTRSEPEGKPRKKSPSELEQEEIDKWWNKEYGKK